MPQNTFNCSHVSRDQEAATPIENCMTSGLQVPNKLATMIKLAVVDPITRESEHPPHTWDRLVQALSQQAHSPMRHLSLTLAS